MLAHPIGCSEGGGRASPLTMSLSPGWAASLPISRALFRNDFQKTGRAHRPAEPQISHGLRLLLNGLARAARQTPLAQEAWAPVSIIESRRAQSDS